MTVADSRRESWSPTAPSRASARLPVTWTPDGGGPWRPRFGLAPGDIERRERARRRRVIIGAGTALFGVVAFFAGSFLNSGHGDSSTAKLQRALVLQEAGRLDEAALLYRQVIATDPDSPVAYFNLGVVEHTKGQTQEAAADYLQVLALDPAYVPALFNLAILRAEEGDAPGAIGLYRRVLAVEPNQASALLNLGILLLQEGQEAEASELITRAIAANPSLSTDDSTPSPSGPAGGAATTTPADATESSSP